MRNEFAEPDTTGHPRTPPDTELNEACGLTGVTSRTMGGGEGRGEVMGAIVMLNGTPNSPKP